MSTSSTATNITQSSCNLTGLQEAFETLDFDNKQSNVQTFVQEMEHFTEEANPDFETTELRDEFDQLIEINEQLVSQLDNASIVLLKVLKQLTEIKEKFREKSEQRIDETKDFTSKLVQCQQKLVASETLVKTLQKEIVEIKKQKSDEKRMSNKLFATRPFKFVFRSFYNQYEVITE